MNQKIKTKWVAALRSGRFKQVTSQLKRGDNGYCCLGVLCTVAGLTISPDGCEVVQSGRRGYEPIHDMLGSNAITERLYQKNDDGQTFEQIAAYIEEKL